MEVIILSKIEFNQEHKYFKKKAKKFTIKKMDGMYGSIVNYYNSNNEIDLRIITGRL